MEIVERKRPRGAFLNLFDWPGKSRKKLFSSNVSQISEESKQEAKENAQNHAIFEVDQSMKNSTYNNPRSGDNSSCCASSVASDDGNVVRAPSVVARLMGLECLPLPNLVEPPPPRVHNNPHLDPYCLRSSRQDHDFDSVSWDQNLDSRTNKGPRKRMIERFQTETLPPRSAKPISVTHNKLLSPIRNPGFVPSRNPAYVMEAASRMIEPSPQRMIARTRMTSSSDASSPVPLRIRDLKEKLEAAQKVAPASTSSSCPPQPQISNNGNSKYLTEKKTKPPSFSSQPKASSSSQKQESLSKRTSSGQKEKAEAKNRAVKSQNSSLKGSSSLSAGKNVLKQNYQKQNCRDNNNHQSRKVMNKVVNKVLVENGTTSSKSPSFTTMSSSAEKSSSSRKKSLPRSKKPRNNGVQEQGIYEDKRVKRGEKSIKCNISIDGDSNTSKDDQKKRDMDVISFTFSSSIKGLSSHLQQAGAKQDADSAVKFNVIGGDSLNALLEQTLRELTSKIESSSSSLIQEESLSSISKDGGNGMISYSSPSRNEKSIQNSLESESVSDCTSFYDNQKFQKKKIQGEEHEVNSISNLTETDDFASCSKSFSDCRLNGEYGMKQSSSDQELTWFSSNESHQTLDETDTAGATLDWELEYITEILNSDQLKFQDFASTEGEESLSLLPSSLFDEMERARGGGAATAMKIERKALFDFVNECLAVKLERMLIGKSCKGGIFLEHNRHLLAEEVNREVKGLKKMREMMIDELVDHDMSCLEGRWIGFEREMFEEGIDIEGEIVSSLVDELVSDLWSS